MRRLLFIAAVLGVVGSLALAAGVWLSNGEAPELQVWRDQYATWHYGEAHSADMRCSNPTTAPELFDFVHRGAAGPWPWIAGFSCQNPPTWWDDPEPNTPGSQWRWYWYYGLVPPGFWQQQGVTVYTYSGENIGTRAGAVRTLAVWDGGGGQSAVVGFTKPIAP